MTKDNQKQIENKYVIASEVGIKAYLHPVRMKIMGLLVPQAMTISQAAKEFGVHPANITHHFKLLEKAGLIKIVERRDIGRNVEKYYRALARHFEVRTKKEQIAGANAMALDIIQHDLTEARNQLQGDDSELLKILLWNTKIEKSQFVKFSKKLQQLMKEYQSQKIPEGKAYSLSLGLYPCSADYGPTGRVEIE